MSQGDHSQFLVDAGLSKNQSNLHILMASARTTGKPSAQSATFIECCEAKAMKSSAITAWEGRSHLVFL
jgi:hypothetical protein